MTSDDEARRQDDDIARQLRIPAIAITHSDDIARQQKIVEALGALEKEINRLLIEFVNATGCDIDNVRVDTRNFANLNVEVSVK